MNEDHGKVLARAECHVRVRRWSECPTSLRLFLRSLPAITRERGERRERRARACVAASLASLRPRNNGAVPLLIVDFVAGGGGRGRTGKKISSLRRLSSHRNKCEGRARRGRMRESGNVSVNFTERSYTFLLFSFVAVHAFV